MWCFLLPYAFTAFFSLQPWWVQPWRITALPLRVHFSWVSGEQPVEFSGLYFSCVSLQACSQGVESLFGSFQSYMWRMGFEYTLRKTDSRKRMKFYAKLINSHIGKQAEPKINQKPNVYLSQDIPFYPWLIMTHYFCMWDICNPEAPPQWNEFRNAKTMCISKNHNNVPQNNLQNFRSLSLFSLWQGTLL